MRCGNGGAAATIKDDIYVDVTYVQFRWFSPLAAGRSLENGGKQAQLQAADRGRKVGTKEGGGKKEEKSTSTRSGITPVQGT